MLTVYNYFKQITSYDAGYNAYAFVIQQVVLTAGQIWLKYTFWTIESFIKKNFTNNIKLGISLKGEKVQYNKLLRIVEISQTVKKRSSSVN